MKSFRPKDDSGEPHPNARLHYEADCQESRLCYAVSLRCPKRIEQAFSWIKA